MHVNKYGIDNCTDNFLTVIIKLFISTKQTDLLLPQERTWNISQS